MQRKNKKNWSANLLLLVLKKNFDLIIKLATLVTKAELKTEQDKTMKLQTYDLSYFLDKNLFVMMVFIIYLFINQHLIR